MGILLKHRHFIILLFLHTDCVGQNFVCIFPEYSATNLAIDSFLFAEHMYTILLLVAYFTKMIWSDVYFQVKSLSLTMAERWTLTWATMSAFWTWPWSETIISQLAKFIRRSSARRGRETTSERLCRVILFYTFHWRRRVVVTVPFIQVFLQLFKKIQVTALLCLIMNC